MNSKRITGLGVTALLGLSLAGIAAAPAHADNYTSNNNSSNYNNMAWNPDIDYPRDPMPASYPWAAPASLHLYHWSDYTMSDLEAGSYSDMKWEHMMAMRQARLERMKKYAYLDNDRTTSSEWTSSSANPNMSTSSDMTVTNSGDTAMQMHRRAGEMDDDDRLNTDPVPIDYPFAAPGSINMFHWRDYTMTDLDAGSYSDRKAEMEMERLKKDAERRAMHNSSSSMNR